MTSRTAVVTVTFNSSKVLSEMLASVPIGTKLITVDNSSIDASVEIAMNHGANVIRFEANEGFGRGCNAGASVCDEEFLLFLNPDARLEEGALEELERIADLYPDSPAFNPMILNPEGRPQVKRRSLLIPRDQWIPRGVPEDGAVLPSLLGGALFCRRKCFEAVGGFDQQIFLYHEDDDLALRLSKTFGELRFALNAVVTHDAGHSSGRSFDVARFKGFHMARSRIHVMRKHGVGLPNVSTFALAVFGLLAPYNLFSKRRRGKYLGQISGSISAIRDGGSYAGPGHV